MKSLLPRRLQTVLRSAWPSVSDIDVPRRVKASIGENDANSEMLVIFIQVLVFSIWLVAWIAAPQPNPETVSSVPLVLSIYLVVAVVRLFATVNTSPGAAYIYLTIAVDMVLLTYLIWSFHIQYDQPASFSLKAVEVMNYFVLISMRALRFQARYVLAAGAAAVICWAGIVLYVVSADASDPMITRDYVTYLTTNSVLIGAEISKGMSIIIFTLVLAVVVRRAQYFLISSVTEEEAARDLSRFMATPAADQIRSSDTRIQAGEGVRRDAAIVNVDIRGFSQMVVDMTGDEAMRVLSDYQHQIVPIVHRHNGAVDKFMGDGIMVTFGVLENDEHYCANALKFMDDVMREQSEWQGPARSLTINLAATEGPVIFGAVGDGDRLELTVIGASVNRSAKLEKHNKVIGSKAIAEGSIVKKAVNQGYQLSPKARTISTTILDDTAPSTIVILA